METYVRFTTADGTEVLVEAAEAVRSSTGGVEGAGPGQQVRKTVVAAREAFEVAASNAVRHSSQSLVEAVRRLDPLPQEVQVTFGLKVSGELGVFTVAKVAGEANYSVTLSWKFDGSSGDGSTGGSAQASG